ncbi:hypothetical protein ACX8Z9_13475 [Arthrobacter halodurans]|uniref:PI-type proteinase n=1 Tax=Arthrobacter halodurans TaxID=516699 RepID=A0ABV4USX3_9MICC
MTSNDSTHQQGEKHDEDVVSDPALNDEQGQEWSDEGGATTEGPATSDD